MSSTISSPESVATAVSATEPYKTLFAPSRESAEGQAWYAAQEGQLDELKRLLAEAAPGLSRQLILDMALMAVTEPWHEYSKTNPQAKAAGRFAMISGANMLFGWKHEPAWDLSKPTEQLREYRARQRKAEEAQAKSKQQ